MLVLGAVGLRINERRVLSMLATVAVQKAQRRPIELIPTSTFGTMAEWTGTGTVTRQAPATMNAVPIAVNAPPAIIAAVPPAMASLSFVQREYTRS